MKVLHTTLGPKRPDELGVILPHEHVFVDLRHWNQEGYAQAEASDVVALMAPEIEKARARGATAIVECSTGGVGRRADLDLAVSKATAFPLVVPTGWYREPWIPDTVKAAPEDQLYEAMLAELEGDIERTGVKAAWIKLSAGDEGLTEAETKILRAAGRAAARTGAVIGSHTTKGRVVRDQLAVLEAVGADPARFIWIHAQKESDFAVNLEMAARGVFIEYDNLGNSPDEGHLERILRLLEAGHADRILLSHDRGWYDPAKPGGGVPKPYTHLFDAFLPKLRAAGVDEATITRLTVANPFDAFAR